MPKLDKLAIIDQSLVETSIGATTTTVSITGGGAPTGASYVVLAVDSGLTNERVLSDGNGISLVETGPKGAVTVAVNLASPSGLEFSSAALQVADSMAGAGLTIASKVFAVGAGTGIAANADDIYVDFSELTGESPTFAGLTINGAITITGDVDGVDISDLAAAQFVTLAANAEMANERVLTAGSGITFNDGGAGAAITISADYSIIAGDGLVDGGADIDLGTPGTLTYATANSVSATSHFHEVEASSAPGAAASLLETTAAGLLTLEDLIVNDQIFINDTANTEQTNGITIKTSTGGDEMIALKHSALAHGYADTETDTFFTVQATGTSGATIRGLSAGGFGLRFEAINATEQTGTGTASSGPIQFTYYKTDSGTVGANANVFLIQAYRGTTETIFLVDEDGDTYIDGNLYDLQDPDTGLIFGGSDSLAIQAGGVTMLDIVEGATDYINVTQGLLFVNETANANQTIGITINVETNGNEAIALKGSNVAHGVTTETETDTFGILQINNSTAGGLLFRGFSEGTTGLNMNTVATSEVTTTTAASVGAFIIRADKKSGTGLTTLGSTANIVAFRNGNNSTHLFTGGGDINLDGTANDAAFDDKDDPAMARALQTALASPANIIRSRFDEMVRYNKDDLTKAGLITIDETGHTFISLQQSIKLLLGAVWQQQTKIYELEERLNYGLH